MLILILFFIQQVCHEDDDGDDADGDVDGDVMIMTISIFINRYHKCQYLLLLNIPQSLYYSPSSRCLDEQECEVLAAGLEKQE